MTLPANFQIVQIVAARERLWQYYERVALRRGAQGARNSNRPGMKYGQACERIFPQVTEAFS